MQILLTWISNCGASKHNHTCFSVHGEYRHHTAVWL